ncbi:MAG: assembly factor cbp4 [Claussenomyces sp. TS43310]|nr:MAG: assembly factor cbp4 [Claussenomyces sp. TS43310]
MPPKAGNWRMYTKMLLGGALVCVGGPALVYYVSPTEEELFLKYNPELQKRSLENRIGKQQDFDAFVGKLKEYSKSDRPIWAVAADDDRARRAGMAEEQAKLVDEMRKRKDQIKAETRGGVKGMPGGSSALE